MVKKKRKAKKAKKATGETKWSEWLFTIWPEGAAARRYVKRAEAEKWTPAEVYSRAPERLKVQACARAEIATMQRPPKLIALRNAKDATIAVLAAIQTTSGTPPTIKRVVKAELARLRRDLALWREVVVPQRYPGSPFRSRLVRRWEKVESR